MPPSTCTPLIRSCRSSAPTTAVVTGSTMETVDAVTGPTQADPARKQVNAIAVLTVPSITTPSSPIAVDGSAWCRLAAASRNTAAADQHTIAEDVIAVDRVTSRLLASTYTA